MLQIVQGMLIVLYWALPPACFVATSLHARRIRRLRPIISFTYTGLLALIVGPAVLWANAIVLRGQVSALEFARYTYLTLSVFCLLRVISRLMLRGGYMLARVRIDDRGRVLPGFTRRAMAVMFVQRTVLVALAIPYLAALAIVYRPRLDPAADSRRRLMSVAENVTIASADGVSLAAWWIPASPQPDQLDASLAAEWGRQTVVLCPGFAASKEVHASLFAQNGRPRELGIIDALASSGFNVLALDPRGQGQSAQRLVTFGMREKRDVIGAANWVRNAHAAESNRICAIGVNTGAAAVLAAAADRDGQTIDAIVLFEPYADLGDLLRSISERAFSTPVSWLVSRLGPPIASAHCGADLAGFSPASLAPDVWPRPLLVVHGRGETFISEWHGRDIPALQEMEVYRRAWQPKDEYWPTDDYARRRAGRRRTWQSEMLYMFQEIIGIRASITADPGAQRHAIEFLRNAQARPVL